MNPENLLNVNGQEIASRKRRLERKSDYCTRADVYKRTLAYEGYDRSFIKRNAMTFSYSSRSYGFAEQLRTDIMKPLSRNVRLGELDEHPFGKDRGYFASVVLARVHEQAIRRHGYVCLYRDGFLTKLQVMRYTTRTSISLCEPLGFSSVSML